MSFEKAGKYACFEFERKFLLKELPKDLLNSKDYKIIEDKYFKGTNLRLRIVTSPDKEILDRKLTQKFVPENSTLAINNITNLYLNEIETALLNQLPGFVLRKKRYKLKHDNYNFSVDEFEGNHLGLIIAEIEFETEEQMNNFSNPFIELKEVTLEYQYSGGSLAII